MATGLIKGNTVVGIKAESTEGTFVAPAAVTDYFQVLQGIDMTPSRELIDRAVITSSPGKPTPRLGLKSVSAKVPVEFRASGTAGSDVDYGLLLKTALGNRRQITTETTSKNATHTTTVIGIADADISKFTVGDVVVVKQSGAYEARPISAVDATPGASTITFPFALSGIPANSVVISKTTMHFTAASGHPSLSLPIYWGNEIRMAMAGAKVTSMSLANFAPGKVAEWNFGLEGLTFTEIDGAAPHTPTYNTGLPPIILNACVWRAGVQTAVNSFAVDLTNDLGFITSTCSANGRTSARVKGRTISGSLNPYKDDTSVSIFDDWVAGTEFSLFAYAYNPAASAGEFTLGSVVAIWLPQCVTTEYHVGEVDAILANELKFRATRGANGTSEEMYVGII